MPDNTGLHNANRAKKDEFYENCQMLCKECNRRKSNT